MTGTEILTDDICRQIEERISLLYPAYTGHFQGNKPQLIKRVCQEITQENALGSLDISTAVTAMVCMYELHKTPLTVNLATSTHYKVIIEYGGQQYTFSPADIFKQVEPLYISTIRK
jgi:hypothetical protein